MVLEFYVVFTTRTASSTALESASFVLRATDRQSFGEQLRVPANTLELRSEPYAPVDLQQRYRVPEKRKIIVKKLLSNSEWPLWIQRCVSWTRWAEEAT